MSNNNAPSSVERGEISTRAPLQSQAAEPAQSESTPAAAAAATAVSTTNTTTTAAEQDEEQNAAKEQPKPKIDLDTMMKTCRSIVGTFHDHTADITRVLTQYKYILTQYKAGTPMYTDEARDYIRDRFLEDSCVMLMKRESFNYNDWAMADTITDICKLLVSIAVPLIQEDSPLAMQIIYYCMNSANAFFRHYGHDWRQRRGSEIDEDESEELKEWRETEVEEGRCVDYLIGNRWRYGVIKSVVPKASGADGEQWQVLYIQPQMDGMYPAYQSRGHAHSRHHQPREAAEAYTDDFSLSSKTLGQIAKPLSKSVEFLPHMVAYRRELELDSKCDVLDSVHKWYTCTVIEVDPGSNRFKVNYDGWSARYDEWVYRDEPRFQPHLTIAKGGRESQGVSGTVDELEPLLDDQEDPSDVFAVYRGRLNNHSFHLVEIVNEFGRCGGFDAIIERLQNRDKNIPVRNLRHVISPLSKCYKMYSAETAAKFIPQLCELTFETLSSLTDVELRDLRKDFLERIISSVDMLLRRHKSSEEIAKTVEEFQMKMALRRLKCATIERRVNGIQYIADVCSRTRRHHGHYYTVRYYTPERLMQWIEESELLALLFGGNSHPQLMKQSADVLKFICNEQKLSLAHLDIIWAAVQRAAAKQDDVENELETLCSLIESITFHLDQPHFDFMFDKFEAIEKQTFTAHHLQLMSSLSQSNAKHTNPPQRCLDILWDIVQDESGCQVEIVEQAKGLIKECLARLFSQELRIPTMNKCISNIKQHKSVCASLQLLVKIIELYPIQSHMSNEPVRWTIIGDLEDNSKVLEHFFNDLKQFKTTAQHKIAHSSLVNDVEIGDNDAAVNNLYVAKFSKKKYLEEIEERLNFLQYIVSNNHTIKLTEHYADILWTSFIVNALSMKERELTFRAFRRMVVAGRSTIYLQESVPQILFTKHMMHDLQIGTMTLSAYECFERYFVFVNCEQLHLQMLENHKSFVVNSYEQLIGLAMLWQIALSCRDDQVHKKSTELINKICNRVSAALKDQLGAIRQSVLEKVMNELLQSVEGANADSDKAERILNLLDQFLNASECRGMGGLRPHEALSRGKKWHVTIINKIAFHGYGKAPQFKVAVHEHDSLWDLRLAVAKKSECYPELVKVIYRGTIFDDAENSLSLQQLNLRDGVTVSAQKKDQKSERVPLMSGTPPRLVKAMIDALTNIHGRFSTNDDNTMSMDDMRRYILECGAGESSANKGRIQSIFAQHGTQPRGYQDRLSLNGFYNFYKSACMDRVDHVWNDLGVFSFRYDLRHEDEARKEEEALFNANPVTLPRYILTTSNKYFDILFNNCLKSKSSRIRALAWKLILRLPTNPGRKKQIAELSGAVDWQQLLPADDLFSLVYGVLICESLTVEPESQISDAELRERANWRATFLQQKGFEHLVQTLFTVEYNNENVGDAQHDDKKRAQQLALTAILKMIESFFVGAVSCNPSMSDLVDQLRSISLNATDESKEDKDAAAATVAAAKKAKKAKKAPKPKQYETYYDNPDYQQVINDSDDEDDYEDDDAGDAAQDFTALLEKQFGDAVMKASGMPESMYVELEQKYDGEGSGSGGGATTTGEADMIGPQLPGQMAPQQQQPGGGGGGGGTTAPAMTAADEKDGKEEKLPPPDEDEDNDVEMAADNTAAAVAQPGGGAGADDANKSKDKPLTHRQSAVLFHETAKKVTGKYAQQLLDSLDFAKLMMQLLHILKVASTDPTPTTQRDLVVRNAVRLWVSVLLYQPNLLLELFDFIAKDPSFMLAAIQSTDLELGSEFAKSIRKLCRYVDESPNYKSDADLQAKLPGIKIVKFFLGMLLDNLPKADQKDIDPEQHFYLLITLMQEYSEKYNGSVAEFVQLFKFLCDELVKYRSQETFENIMVSDKILVGMMTLMSVLLTGHTPFREQCGTTGIIAELLNNFLFATGKTEHDKARNLPKCKSFAARELAYRLVVQCVMDVPANYPIINEILDELHAAVRTPNHWEYAPEKSVKSDRGFVGLRNLGSTCYMNSLLQQFYMMPHFRHALIQSAVDLTPDLTVEQQSDSLLYNMTRMFSFLSLSEKQAFDTICFCRAYKDETGRPVDVRIQQDAQEFFTILADRIETELKGTRYRYLLQDAFGGQIGNQMICQGGCNKTRENKQPMPMISLPIKNRSNMQESLEAFVQAEQLDGVSCDDCQKKCTTLKRQVLHTLPNTIFFHLKRFELNFETFRHEKSNQRFEFPTEIDLEPYTREGLRRREAEEQQQQQDNENAENDNKNDDDNNNNNAAAAEPEQKQADTRAYSEHPEEYYKYQLCGVVVHTGSAEAGHYYSFIKDRTTGEWNEFNDSLIKPFDLKWLDEECFGGKKKVKTSAQWNGDWDHDQEKIKNGYILIYDRVQYEQVDHQEDLKREIEEVERKQKEAAAKAAEEAAAAAANGATKDESKQEQDNKEQEKGDAQPAAAAEVTAAQSSMSMTTTNAEENNGDAAAAAGGDDDDNAEPTKAPFPDPIDVNSYTEANVKEFVDKMPKLYEEILETNVKFMRDRQLFNLQYFRFIYNLICVAPTLMCTDEILPPMKKIGTSANADDEQEQKLDEAVRKSIENNAGLGVIQMATFVCFRFLARTADKRVILGRFVTYLKFLYESNVPACKWLLVYLSDQRQYVEQYILGTRDLHVMDCFSSLVVEVLRRLKDIEAGHLMETEEIIVKVPVLKPTQFSAQTGQPLNLSAVSAIVGNAAAAAGGGGGDGQFIEQQRTVSTCPSSKFLDLMLELLEVCPKYWYRFTYYFQVFYEYALMSSAARNFLIDKQMINVLGDFYLGQNQSPYASDAKKQYPIMGNRMYPPNFTLVIQTFCTLLCACHTPQTTKILHYYASHKDQLDDAMKAKWLRLPITALSFKDAVNNPDEPDRDCLHPLSEKDSRLPHCRFLYDRLILEAHNNKDVLDALNALAVHWAYEDPKFSNEVISIITEGVDRSGADQVKTYMAIMAQFIAIEDTHRESRLKLLHVPEQRDKGVLHFIKVYRSKHQPFSYTCMQALVDMMYDNESYAAYMMSIRPHWEWWDQWIDLYVHRTSSYVQNQNMQRFQQKKIEWFETRYVPLLSKYEIEVQRAPPIQHTSVHQSNMRGQGMYSHGAYGTGGVYNPTYNDQYFASQNIAGNVDDIHGVHAGNGVQPGSFDDGVGGAVGVGHSRDNSELYDNLHEEDGAAVADDDADDADDNPGLNEGAAGAIVHGAMDNEAHSDDDIAMQHDDEDDDDNNAAVAPVQQEPLQDV